MILLGATRSIIVNCAIVDAWNSDPGRDGPTVRHDEPLAGVVATILDSREIPW